MSDFDRRLVMRCLAVLALVAGAACGSPAPPLASNHLNSCASASGPARSGAVGSPLIAAAAGAMAARTSSTTISGTPRPRGRWTTSATAPRATASGAKSWPSRVNPGTQKNSVPGVTSRLS